MRCRSGACASPVPAVRSSGVARRRPRDVFVAAAVAVAARRSLAELRDGGTAPSRPHRDADVASPSRGPRSSARPRRRVRPVRCPGGGLPPGRRGSTCPPDPVAPEADRAPRLDDGALASTTQQLCSRRSRPPVRVDRRLVAPTSPPRGRPLAASNPSRAHRGSAPLVLTATAPPPPAGHPLRGSVWPSRRRPRSRGRAGGGHAGDRRQGRCARCRADLRLRGRDGAKQPRGRRLGFVGDRRPSRVPAGSSDRDCKLTWPAQVHRPLSVDRPHEIKTFPPTRRPSRAYSSRCRRRPIDSLALYVAGASEGAFITARRASLRAESTFDPAQKPRPPQEIWVARPLPIRAILEWQGRAARAQDLPIGPRRAHDRSLTPRSSPRTASGAATSTRCPTPATARPPPSSSRATSRSRAPRSPTSAAAATT